MNFIPDKFYVGKRKDGMGFMTHTVKEGFAGRKKTVDTWCNGWHFDPETRERVSEPGIILEVDNAFKKGFEILVNNRRYSTDNVVWNVKHPEGFVFQITSENFCDLLQHDTITKGVLSGEYHFVRSSGGNVLAKKGSTISEKAVSQKEIETKVSTTKLAVGDKVTLKASNTCEYIYLGAFHLLPSLGRSAKWNEKPEFSVDHKTVKRHVFRKSGVDKFDHNYYTTLASPKVLGIIEKGFENITSDDCFEELKNSLFDLDQKQIGNPEHNYYLSARPVSLTDSPVIGISKKATTMAKMKVLLEKIPDGVVIPYGFADRGIIDTCGNNCYVTENHGLKVYQHSGQFAVYESDVLELESGGKYYVPVYCISSGWRQHWQRKIIYSTVNKTHAGTIVPAPSEQKFLQLLVGE